MTKYQVFERFTINEDAPGNVAWKNREIVEAATAEAAIRDVAKDTARGAERTFIAVPVRNITKVTVETEQKITLNVTEASWTD